MTPQIRRIIIQKRTKRKFSMKISMNFIILLILLLSAFSCNIFSRSPLHQVIYCFKQYPEDQYTLYYNCLSLRNRNDALKSNKKWLSGYISIQITLPVETLSQAVVHLLHWYVDNSFSLTARVYPFIFKFSSQSHIILRKIYVDDWITESTCCRNILISICQDRDYLHTAISTLAVLHAFYKS